MLDSLPYELPELVTRAPLDTHTSKVLPEWVDWNGHMNVAFYVTSTRPRVRSCETWASAGATSTASSA